MTTQPLTRRVNRGRYHSYILDGEPCESVTTILREGVPKPALIQWACRETAGYALDHWDELGSLGVAERLRRLERAPNERRNEQAVRGTIVHDLAHRLAAGETVDVPDHARGHVDAYLRFAEEWSVEDELVETTTGHRRWRYMGTFDLMAYLPDLGRTLLDFKTTASGVYAESALQLAAYRYAEFYLDPQTGEELAMPEVDATAIVWLRADGYDLVPVIADEQTFRVFLYAQQVAQFAKTGRDGYVRAALTPSTASSA